jgi:hypothetical protein
MGGMRNTCTVLVRIFELKILLRIHRHGWRIHIHVDNKETGSDDVHLLSIGTSDRLM